jgi:hypothetical protein
MATAARPANNKVDMLTNVPIRMSIKYIDVYPDSGKGYGASMRLKGTIDGADAIVYPKGKVWAAVKAMKAAGVIDANGEYADEPTEKYSIPVIHADVEMVMRQAAGEKYATFAVNTYGTARVVPTTPKPVASHNTIGRVPWEDEQETGGPPAPTRIPTDHLAAVATEYAGCLTRARQLALEAKLDTLGGDLAGTVQAIAATLFIETNKRTR